MSNRISDDALNAYLDGELAPSAMLEVERMLAASPVLKQRLAVLAESGGLVRAAYNAPLQESAPPALQAAIEDAFDRRRKAGARESAAPKRRGWWTLLGVAGGALAAIAVVVVAGTLMIDARVEQRLAEIANERAAQRTALESAIQRALEAKTSGQKVEWQAAGRTLSGTVTPVRTFRNSDGRWCREYMQQINAGSRYEVRQGIACRDPDGVWRTRMETYLDS